MTATLCEGVHPCGVNIPPVAIEYVSDSLSRSCGLQIILKKLFKNITSLVIFSLIGTLPVPEAWQTG